MPDKQKQAQYILNRVDLIKGLKAHAHILEKIVAEGIETEEDQRVAKVACCVILAEFHYEDEVMNDKSDNDSGFMIDI